MNKPEAPNATSDDTGSYTVRTLYRVEKNGEVSILSEVGILNIQRMSRYGKVVGEVLHQKRYNDYVLFELVTPIENTIIKETRINKKPATIVCAGTIGTITGEFCPVILERGNDNSYTINHIGVDLNKPCTYSLKNAIHAAIDDGSYFMATELLEVLKNEN